jgi:hypothetical protein
MADGSTIGSTMARPPRGTGGLSPLARLLPYVARYRAWCFPRSLFSRWPP